MLRRPQISLLVPFRVDPGSPHRAIVWDWLKAYWKYELPDAEIVMGVSTSEPFSKTEAVNNAVGKARGRIFVILDADTYMKGSEIQHCADAIEESIRRGHPLWFIPYRHLYRLNRHATKRLLNSSPKAAIKFPSPPRFNDVEDTAGSMHGHRFGALIQILPREAFEAVGCMDPRFKGWGGEDVAFVRAVDTLYGKHKTIKADALHLWHDKIGANHASRMWHGQEKPRVNEQLASRYNKAVGDRAKMRQLVDEGCQEICQECNKKQNKWIKVLPWVLLAALAIYLAIKYL